LLKTPGNVELSRTVRFAVSLRPSKAGSSAGNNSFAGLPSMHGLGAHYEVTVSVAGEPDARTGYLLNISEIDRAVRERVAPLIAAAVHRDDGADPAAVLRDALHALRAPLARMLRSIRWHLSPYYSLAMTVDADDRVEMRQSFEFAAAHRLHVDQLDDRTNQEMFGKCNNPSGHGHNYRVEVAVHAPLSLDGRVPFTLQRLESIVEATVIRRFDHKHLNRDTAEFAAVNPSVENIARVCHDLLLEPIAHAGAALARVTVWETEKTCCSYPAGASAAMK